MKKSKFRTEFPNLLPALLLPTLLALATGCSVEPNEPPPPATNPWSGSTYLLDINEGNWTIPRGIGAEIDDFVPSFLIRVDSDEPDTFEVTMGTSLTDGVQDTCNQTSSLYATANPPGMAIGPTEFPIHIQHVEQPIAVDGMIYDLTISNVLPHEGEEGEEGVLVGTMDFRELYPLITAIIEVDPDKVCAAFLSSYPNNPCAPCPTDGEPYCMTVQAEYLDAVPNDGVIEPVNAVDPSCTPMP